MNCRECQEFLDALLFEELSERKQAELTDHVNLCPSCAAQYALTAKTLAALRLSHEFQASPRLRESIMVSVASLTPREMTAGRAASATAWRGKYVLMAAAAALLILVGGIPYFYKGGTGPTPGGQLMAVSLFADALAAEDEIFTGNSLVYILGEIVVQPVSDPNSAKMRWFPVGSLAASGKPEFHQLKLPADVGKGYTVKDECWYDPTGGRFLRVLSGDGQPILANSYDGRAVYWLDTEADGGPRVIRNPIEKGFSPPKDPAEILGVAAGLHANLADKSLVEDAGVVTLDDGTKARIVRASFPKPDHVAKQDVECLFTIREDTRTIAKIELVADGQSLYVVRRLKTDNPKTASVGWDMAGLVKPTDKPHPKPSAGIARNMVIPDVSVAHMIEKAGFKTYVFSESLPWAKQRQIVDVLDVASPPKRMFLIAYRAEDGRHVILVQAPTYNKMIGPMAKTGKLIYTSPRGVKVWSGPRDKWLAGILLQSARGAINFTPSDDVTGHVLETPDGTFPALAINGKLTEKELQEWVDGLVPAKEDVNARRNPLSDTPAP